MKKNLDTVKSFLVCYTAVFRIVTQRSSPLCGEERYVTTPLSLHLAIY